MFTIMNKKLNFTERINKLISYYDISANEMARRVGGSRTKVYNAINGKVSPGFETIEAILSTFPDVSAEWLVRGDGAMMKSEMIMKSEVDQLIAKYKVVREMYREEVKKAEEPLRTSFKPDAVNPQQEILGDPYKWTIKSAIMQGVPVADQKNMNSQWFISPIC